MQFIAIDGSGDPNTSEEYAAAVEVIYALSYAVKMGNKGILEYVVAPLEGFWEAGSGFRGGAPIVDKSKFIWTMLIRQPAFVDSEIFEAARLQAAKKKPTLGLSKARLETITEGICVQAMHFGPYDTEHETIARMDKFAAQNGYGADMAGARRHHEIYLSGPRKVAPEKLKTVIRHPIRKA